MATTHHNEHGAPDMTSVARGSMRITQIRDRLAAKHPKAARDPELAAMIKDLDDIIQYEVTDLSWSTTHQRYVSAVVDDKASE